jgi:hypothetical protein
MTPLSEIRRLEGGTLSKKIERLKPRRVRRQEKRDRVRAAKETAK